MTADAEIAAARRALAAADDTIAVGVVYLAGPVTPTPARSLELNIATAARTLAYLTERRVAAHAPQLTACRAELADAVIGYENWMAVDFLILRACACVLALPGWEGSAGTRRELLFATGNGIPVFYTVRQVFDHFGVSARAARPLKG